MPLTLDNKRDIILYRIEKSKLTMNEARDNAALQHWNLVANRLYYALFYMVAALLLDRGIHFKSHAGAIRAVGLHFVSKGVLSPEEGRLISRLQSMRSSGDYDDLFDWTEEKVRPMFQPVDELLEKLRGLISLK